MSKNWFKPPGARSPYEDIGRGGGKVMRPAERVEPEHVQGCGRVGCPICMPKDGRRRSGQVGGPGSSYEAYEDEMRAAINRAYGFTPVFSMEVDRSRTVRIDSAAPSDPGKERLRQAELEARKPVERYLLKSKPGVAWDDVVGNDTARRHLVEAIEHPIRHAELYRHYGKRPTKGVLLYGPPGCGKTMFGKAAASVIADLCQAAEATVLSLKGPEIQSPYVGVTERTIREIFAYARAYKALHGHPLVIFIDEADALLPSRDGRALAYEESQVAAFLAEMDGIEESGALVILATNRPEAIDAAVLRDGRIDRKVRVERPDRAAAEVIFDKALDGVPLATLVDGLSEAPTRAALAWRAAESVFDPERVVAHLATDAGPRLVRLSDVVNGAMLVGIVEQAKGNAFRRDLAAGGAPSGLARADLEQAITSVVAQNRGLNHVDVIREIAAREGFTAARVIPPDAAGPHYTIDADDNVVRLR